MPLPSSPVVPSAVPPRNWGAWVAAEGLLLGKYVDFSTIKVDFDAVAKKLTFESQPLSQVAQVKTPCAGAEDAAK